MTAKPKFKLKTPSQYLAIALRKKIPGAPNNVASDLTTVKGEVG